MSIQSTLAGIGMLFFVVLLMVVGVIVIHMWESWAEAKDKEQSEYS
jgi:hypothetical protein